MSVPRGGFVAYDATAADIPALVGLCVRAREETGGAAQVCSTDTDRIAEQLAGLLSERGSTVVLVAADGVAIGFMFARIVPPGPIYDLPRAQIEALFVDRDSRRQGAGHAMIAHLTAIAARAQAPEVVCLPLVGSRSLPRFFARLGFAPVASHRVIPTEALARRLDLDPTGTVCPPRRRGLEELIARRRRTRDTGEVPLVRTEANPSYPSDAIERRKQVSRAVANRRSFSSTTTMS